MKTHLLYPDRDFDLQQRLPPNEHSLTQDLALNTLFNAMARGDGFLFKVAKSAVLSSLDDLATIRYRQDVLRDCLNNPLVVREIYQLPIEAIETKQKRWMGVYSNYPSGILSGSVEMMGMFMGLLRRLKNIADEHSHKFVSEGFRIFFEMVQSELSDDYFVIVQDHLRELRFRNGILLSAELGKGNEGMRYVLRRPRRDAKNFLNKVLAKKPPSYSFSIHPRDDHGTRALSELEDRGINLVANALAQSADHVNSFFYLLRLELAFYIGALNLVETLAEVEEPISFPELADSCHRRHSFEGLYDICLALTMKRKIVGNDVSADGKDLVFITGANQGGKSTFLRSIGLAQLMMQCGMFVPAESFSANICNGLLTHYRRKEDASMKSGKLDEELGRMSEIVDMVRPNSMILFNESFAATNEREGSEIARQITNALLARRVKIFFVTHMFDFAHGFYEKKMENAVFLRAKRQPDGARTFTVTEAEPLQTSYGQDLYQKLFEKR
jgi:DNA mismatch repair ATPase MutS